MGKLLDAASDKYLAATIKYNDWFFSLPVAEQERARKAIEPFIIALAEYKELAGKVDACITEAPPCQKCNKGFLVSKLVSYRNGKTLVSEVSCTSCDFAEVLS